MAIVTMDIPYCDKCREVWLPRKGSARANPRESAERCGKCKNLNWDRIYRKANPGFEQTPPESEEGPEGLRRKCQHGYTRCPVCHEAVR